MPTMLIIHIKYAWSKSKIDGFERSEILFEFNMKTTKHRH